MKSLRQLLRRPSQTSDADSYPKRRADNRRNGETTRRLTSQSLEQRQLLAADVGADVKVAHNYWNGFDVNQDRQISPSDALGVINFLAQMQSNRAQGEQIDGKPEDFNGRKVDVNRDGHVTPSDALTVINALARGEQMNELVELRINARDADDNLLAENNGVIEVGVGEENSFFLEVAYSDLRTFGGDLGAFSIFPDIGVSQGSVLRPVLRETQQLIIGEEIRSSSSGVLTIGREGSLETVDATISNIGGDFVTFLSDTLINTFGLTDGDFSVEQPEALKGSNGQDLGFEIYYNADEFGNVDVPDLTFTPNFDNAVPVEFREFAPLNPDGTPNSDAVRFNLDSRNRNLANNAEYYNLLNRGTYDLATGFTDIGGVGAANANGVRGAGFNGAISNFDAFRIEVFIESPLSSPLVVDVNPGEGVDPLTLYGSNDVVPDDLILIDDDATLTFSTGAVVNTPPVLGTVPLTETLTEDEADTSVDLLEDASDPDGDTLLVTNFGFDSGDTSGVTLNGTNLDVTPSSYNALAVGSSNVIVATYDVSDGTASVAQTLTLTITGVNDAPVVSAPIDETFSENDATANVSLLQNASDPDTGDTLDATTITVRAGSGDASGITIDDSNNQLVVDPNAYDSLSNGETVVVTYDYNVTDGNGGSVAQVATITITGVTDGPNTAPTVGAAVMISLSEDDSSTPLDLLTGAMDADGDTLSVSGLTLASGDASGITDNGNSLQIDPSAYNALAATQTETIVYTYQVIDGRGGSVAQSATITIGGANDAPVVSGPVTATFSEDDASGGVDLLANASDVDAGAVLSIAGLTLASGDDSGISSGSATMLMVDPSAYNSLAVGETETIVYNYNVVDDQDATVPQSATITITGANDAPTVGVAITATVSEDDADSMVDLLVGAADADATDTLSVTGGVVQSGDASGVAFNGNMLSLTPSAYNSLAAGETEVVVVGYSVSDGNGGNTPQTATITINGANDAPVVSGEISETFNEDQADGQMVSLLDNASDVDTSDVLDITNVSVTGDQAGVTRNGSNVTVNPRAYDSLELGQSAVITFTYQVTDGTASVNQTATITIEGRDEGIPSVTGPIEVQFDEDDGSANVDLLEGASDPDGDALSVINASITSGDARGVTIDAANNRLVVNPNAYNDLNTGETAVVVVSYSITDGANSVNQTATVTIVGEDEPLIQGSTISGQLFIDHVENADDVLRHGATPFRNGVHDDDERALGGVTVRLLESTSTGEQEIATVLTMLDGSYEITGIDPGTYFIEYDIPSSVDYMGSRRGQIVIGETGGFSLDGPSLDAIGLTGTLRALDLLARTYTDQGIDNTRTPPIELKGGSFEFDEDGQSIFIVGAGFDGVQFAELAMNDAGDAALLSIIDGDNNVRTALLSRDQFKSTAGMEGVRLLGGVEDYSFDFDGGDVDEVRQEFDDYRMAIDQILGAGN